MSVLIKRGDKNFQSMLDMLEKKYFHNGGGPDAEEIWNKNKQEKLQSELFATSPAKGATCLWRS